MSDDVTEPAEPTVVRDQVPSAFAAVLRRLVRAIPGGIGAVFCDSEGEAIDYWGTLDPFDLRIAGAQLGPFHEDLARRLGPGIGIPHLVHIRGESRSYLYRRISADYYLVAVLTAYASWWEARPEVDEAVGELAKEAGIE